MTDDNHIFASFFGPESGSTIEDSSTDTSDSDSDNSTSGYEEEEEEE